MYYNASRKLILKGVDGVVFVADSQIERMEANLEAMQNLYDNMAQHGYDLTRLPFVIQYNKRDLPNAAPIRELQAALNPGWPVEDPRPAAGHAPTRTAPASTWSGRWTACGWSGCPYFEGVAVRGDRRLRHAEGRQQAGAQGAGLISRHVDPSEHHHPGADPDHAGDRAAALHRGLLAQAHLLRGVRGRGRHRHRRRALARSRNLVTDLGKLLDPIADKLLLFATLMPIWWISRPAHDLYDIPIWGSIPLWVCLLLIGREFAMTASGLGPAQGRGDRRARRRQAEGRHPEHLHRRDNRVVRLPGCRSADGLAEQSPTRLVWTNSTAASWP